MNFSMEDVQKFSTLCHPPFQARYLDNYSSKLTKDWLETRHLELSVNKTFEENGARKGLQTAVRKSGHKLRKR